MEQIHTSVQKGPNDLRRDTKYSEVVCKNIEYSTNTEFLFGEQTFLFENNCFVVIKIYRFCKNESPLYMLKPCENAKRTSVGKQ